MPKGIPKIKPYKIKCFGCENEFHPLSKHARFCTENCYKKSEFFLSGARVKNNEYYKRIRADKKSYKLYRRGYWLNKYKVAKGCEICNWTGEAIALEFDHKDQQTKIGNISTLKISNLKKLIDEVRKCRVLCSRCHRIETYKNKHCNQLRQSVAVKVITNYV